jgi:hypothetical protein
MVAVVALQNPGREKFPPLGGWPTPRQDQKVDGMNFLEVALWAQRFPAGPNPAFPGPGQPGFPNAGHAAGEAAGAAVGIFLLSMACGLGTSLLVWLLAIAGFWKCFTKAGQPGWAALIPVYGTMVMAKAAGRPEMDGVLVLIPVVGFYIVVVLHIDFVERFGKGVIFAILAIIFPYVCWPMLGFGNARYSKPKKKKESILAGFGFGGGTTEARPRKKRRVRDDEDEDEEDDLPRRRRNSARDEDDEDEDERPRRRRIADRDDDEEPAPKRKRDERTRRARDDD